jgi:hypothetical protein
MAKKKIVNKNVGSWIKPVIYPLIIIAAILFVLLSSTFIFSAEEKVTIEFVKNPGLWKAAQGTEIRSEGGSLKIIRGSGEGFIVLPMLNLDADWYDVCVIKEKSPIAYDQGRLFFISPYNQRYDFNFSFGYDTGCAEHENIISINLKNHPAWQGIIKEVLFIPAASAKAVNISSIEFIHSNLWTKLRAWWSDFTYYSDPRLGTCFSMGTPVFFGNGFNNIIAPFLLALFLLSALILLVLRMTKTNDVWVKTIIIAFFMMFLFFWALLDLRNNAFQLKTMMRDANLYWGKSLQEKRGIVIGDPEFARFMQYCDDSIPYDGRIFNFVSYNTPGAPRAYLATVQFYYLLRPMNSYLYYASKEDPRPYYIFYLSDLKALTQIKQEQEVVNYYLPLPAKGWGEQRFPLWRDSGFIQQVALRIKPNTTGWEQLAIHMIDPGSGKIIAEGRFERLVEDRAIYNIRAQSAAKRYRKLILKIENRSDKPVEIAAAFNNELAEGGAQIGGKSISGDLAFQVLYDLKGIKLFKNYNENSFILTE